MEGISLLLADDDTDFRSSAIEALSRRGFVVTAAEDGSAAVRLAAAQRFDVAIIDLKMPGLGGIEALTKIRERNPSLPVIILTGHGVLEDAMAGIALGIVDFINKPVDMDALAKRIVALLSAEADLREREIVEVMAPLEIFERLYGDAPMKQALTLLSKGGDTFVLVFDRKERFKGIVEARDLLRVLLPEAIRDSPYASYLTGMFLGQCMLLETKQVIELIDTTFDLAYVNIQAPLMEAVHCLIDTGRSALPVLEHGELKGILTTACLLAEINRIVSEDRRLA